jgi:CubicO group peptidase (beta-lactamase class C family)
VTDAIEIHGHCDDRFSAVKDAFAQNFKDGREVGASFAATIDGETIVDIWGGWADAACTKPWERDTIVNVYSTTKVMAALCTHMLVDRGQLDLDAPVAKYWPEFAQAGKENLPVKFLLSHQSGLSGIVEPLTVEEFYDWDHTVGLLAAQEPLWEPGAHSGYHSLTFGHLLGEVLRRITGKTMGTFFREEVAEPLGADFHIGLSEEHDHRVGELIPPETPRPEIPGIDPNSKLAKAMTNPGLRAEDSRDRAWRAAEIPAANGHGNARSVARVATALACGGELDGVRLLGSETIEKSIEEQCYGKDLVLQIPIRYGLGWGLTSKEMPVGPNPRTFYWGGWGGSAVIMDLDAKMCFAYVMNRMTSDLVGDTRVTGPAIALFSEMMSGS